MFINLNAAASSVLPLIIPSVGRANRMMVKLPVFGKLIVGLSNKALGNLLPHLKVLGFRKAETFEDAISNWETFLGLIGAQYDVLNNTPEEKVYRIFKCPAGYNCLAHLKACQHTMEFDHSLVKASGARLIVDKCIPIDGYCIERIVKA